MDYGYIFAHLTIILTLAATSGIFIGKLKQPIMIGYIIAGVLIGPSCFGLVASQEQVHFYSELGILLLLFVIGMELNIKSFIKMWKIPTLFTVIQVIGSAILAVLLSHVFGFSVYVSLLTAFFTCLSSTAAIVKVLEYLGELKTDVGHISIGILVAQDIAVVPMMLIIKECGKPLGISIVLELAFAIGLVVFMLKYLGKKEQIKLPVNIVPNQELVPVVTLASVFIAATIVSLFGLSEAYGAFLAGLFIGNTQARQSVLNSIKPIQNVLLMVFFLSVGLMFDLRFLLQNWFIVLISLILVTTWKIFFNSVILSMFSIELAKATSIGIILAQLGEFSLVLATVATQSGIIGSYGQKLIICITALSLSISPLFIALSKKTRNLSFVGDNSANSIIKTMFSGKFSRLVEILIERSKNTIKNQIEKAKLSKMQQNNSTEKELVTISSSSNAQSDTINNMDEVSNNNTSVENTIQQNIEDTAETNDNKLHNQLAIIEGNKSIGETKQIEENSNETSNNMGNKEIENNSEHEIKSNEELHNTNDDNQSIENNNTNIGEIKLGDSVDNNITSNTDIENNSNTENSNINNITNNENEISNTDNDIVNTELKIEDNQEEEQKSETTENINIDNEDKLTNKKKSKKLRKLFKVKDKK